MGGGSRCPFPSVSGVPPLPPQGLRFSLLPGCDRTLEQEEVGGQQQLEGELSGKGPELAAGESLMDYSAGPEVSP